ncbi:DUF1217 domain-containing protein [Hyphomonas sp.]|uniref:DUF1217 domain-containing protein n=1 Tax=Hyphomonas sp. TaxID=87 RepID=UPI00391ADE0D
MYQPVIPVSGIGGWRFLQSTYDRQLSSHSENPQVRADRNYLIGKLSEPITTEDFLNDKRLLRIAMTAFDLGGEEWKRGFISKALTEAADPASTWLARLNNSKYTEFAKTFASATGEIKLSEAKVQELAQAYNTAAFELSIGEIDESMRLALNFQAELPKLIGTGSNETAMLYRILGDVPVRTVLETATGLPESMRKLPIEKQAEMLKAALQRTFGINKVSDLAAPDKIDKAIQRYHALESVKSANFGTSGAANALTLLGGSGSGLGPQSSLNLLLSGR